MDDNDHDNRTLPASLNKIGTRLTGSHRITRLKTGLADLKSDSFTWTKADNMAHN